MSVTIHGIADVNRILAELAPKEARNLMRATVFDIAKTAAAIAVKHTPDDPASGVGDLKSSIKAVREVAGFAARGRIKASRNRDGNTAVSAVMALGKRNFFWRFLELGDGPDKIEHAMFGKAIEEMRPDMPRIYVEAFAKKLIARLVRERKRAG